jgi:hypothetical protein
VSARGALHDRIHGPEACDPPCGLSKEVSALLDEHRDEVAHELAEKIREERDAADVPGSPFTPHMAHGAAWAADLIDPEKED